METVAVFRNVCPNVPIGGTVGPKKSVNSWTKQYDTMELMHLMSSMQQVCRILLDGFPPKQTKKEEGDSIQTFVALISGGALTLQGCSKWPLAF